MCNEYRDSITDKFIKYEFRGLNCVLYHVRSANSCSMEIFIISFFFSRMLSSSIENYVNANSSLLKFEKIVELFILVH